MQIPLTLRLVFHGVRAGLRALLLFFCAWIIFVPATTAERAALGAAPDEAYPLGLRPMRSAKAIVTFAPDRAYVLVADLMGPEFSPLLIRIALVQMAAGNVLPATMQTRPEVASDRGLDGPKFIKVD